MEIVNNISKIKRIVFDYRTILAYGAYYYYGFKSVYGNIVSYGLTDVSISNHEEYRKGCAVIIIYDNGKKKRIFIDTNDNDGISIKYYDWCDIYAKINLNPADRNKTKVIAIGPSFGIQIWSPFNTMLKCIKNYVCWNGSYKESLRLYLKDYAYTFYRRLPYEKYNIKCHEERNYMFTLSTLWYDERTFNTTNKLRGHFARACKDEFEHFEGGFYFIKGDGVQKEFPKYKSYMEEYGDLLIYERISMTEYMKRINRASFVFNTPSVCGCHGWKLGEYLAMGKAIISTPLNNVMPGDFIAGTHYIEVTNENEIREAVHRLHEDASLVESLKQKSIEYFDQYLSPVAVVTRILDYAENI